MAFKNSRPKQESASFLRRFVLPPHTSDRYSESLYGLFHVACHIPIIGSSWAIVHPERMAEKPCH